MRHVTLNDVVGLERYEKIRDDFRKKTIAIKKRRRVSIGESITLVFENFDTVLFQIQEMVRAEHIVDLDKVREEIEVYDALLPGPGELSATMLIELDDPARIREQLPKFYGIDQALWLEIDGARVAAVFEEGRSREDKVSAVQYVRFPVGEQRAARFREAREVKLVVDHANYRASQVLSAEVRSSLAADLSEP